MRRHLRAGEGCVSFRWRYLAAAALAGYLALGLLTLLRFPIVWMDEPWYTQPAWSFLTTGQFSAPMFTGEYGQEVSNVAYGRIYLLLNAVIFGTLGLGPYQARVLSLLAGI